MGENLEDEGSFDVAVAVRELQGVCVLHALDLDNAHNDAWFNASDDEGAGVDGVVCKIYWAENDTLYDQGRTDRSGEYEEYDLPEENFTFTIEYGGDIFNTGWFHSSGGGGGSGDSDEWFADWDYETVDTDDDGNDDTIEISYDPDTEADEIDVEVDIDVYY